MSNIWTYMSGFIHSGPNSRKDIQRFGLYTAWNLCIPLFSSLDMKNNLFILLFNISTYIHKV